MLTSQIVTIHIEFSLLKQDIQNLRGRTGTAEEKIDTLEDTLAPHSATVMEAYQGMVFLRSKLNDLENNSTCDLLASLKNLKECLLHTYLMA